MEAQKRKSLDTGKVEEGKVEQTYTGNFTQTPSIIKAELVRQALDGEIEAVEVYSSRQKMADDEIVDRDVFAFDKIDNDCCGMILKIRDGKVIGKTHYFLNNTADKTDSEILEHLITGHYANADFIPDEIFLINEIENEDAVKQWLENRKQGKIEFSVPK